eukprot:13018061-Ditylum_brightwellii.AAC.1
MHWNEIRKEETADGKNSLEEATDNVFGTPQKSSRVNLFKTPTEKEEAEDATSIGETTEAEVSDQLPPDVIT